MENSIIYDQEMVSLVKDTAKIKLETAALAALTEQEDIAIMQN